MLTFPERFRGRSNASRLGRFSRFAPYLCAVLIACLAPGSAAAHRPHDDVQKFAIVSGSGSQPVGLAVVRNNLLRSETLGSDWLRVTHGLDTAAEITAVIAGPRDVFLSTAGGGVFRSADNGQTWVRLSDHPETDALRLLAVEPHERQTLLAVDGNGVLWRYSPRSGAWSEVAVSTTPVTAAAFAGPDHVVLGTDEGELLLLDRKDGSALPLCAAPFSARITDIDTSLLDSDGAIVLAATAGSGIVRARRNGSDCHTVWAEEANAEVTDLSVAFPNSGAPVAFASTRSTILVSFDQGDTWHVRDKGLKRSSQAEDPRYDQPHFRSVTAFPGADGNVMVAVGGFSGLFLSGDLGDTWREVETLPASLITAFSISEPDEHGRHSLGIGTYGAGVLLSPDEGETWIQAVEGLPDMRIRGVAFPTGSEGLPRVVAQVSGALLTASDYGALWQARGLRPEGWSAWVVSRIRPPIERMMHASETFAKLMNKYAPRPNSKLTTHPTILSTAQDGDLYIGTSAGEVYRIDPEGRETEKIGALEHGQIVDLAVVPRNGDVVVYASVSPFVEPPDPGATVTLMRYEGADSVWTKIPLEADMHGKLRVEAIDRADGTVTVAVGWTGGLAITEQDGMSWRRLRVEGGQDMVVDALAMSPDYAEDGTIFLYARGRGLFVVDDFAQTFRRIGDTTFPAKGDVSFHYSFPAAATALLPSSEFASNGTIFATTGDAVFVSRDRGSSWSPIALPPLAVHHR